MKPYVCPHCGVSLVGAEIPVESRRWYGTATHFRREILIELPEVFDGGLFYQCPDCNGQWHRWPEGHYLRDQAARHMAPAAAEGGRMKLLYATVKYFCCGCGRLGYEARIPAGTDETKCGPEECGHCNSTRFRVEKAA